MTNAWQNTNNSWISISSLAFTPRAGFPVSLGTPELWLSRLNAGEKNSLWSLRCSSSYLLRPKDSQSSRLVLWGYARLPGRGDSPRLLSQVPEGEAGKAELVGRLSLLYQAIRLLHWPSLPGFEYSGRGPGVPSELEDSQGLGEAVHAGAVAPSGKPGAQSNRHR